MSDEIVCKQGCGKTFTQDGAWRVKHELKCKGKVQTRGRIERLDARRHPKPGRRHADRTPPAAPKRPDVPRSGFDGTTSWISGALADLRARRDHLDKAIAALEKLA